MSTQSYDGGSQENDTYVMKLLAYFLLRVFRTDSYFLLYLTSHVCG